jgi:small subunit ribosomal protein S20
MANIKSQIKRNRQNEAARRRNQAIRSEMRTGVRHALEAAEAGDADEARTRMRAAQSRIDSAVSKGVLHARTAARHKARLERRIADALSS